MKKVADSEAEKTRKGRVRAMRAYKGPLIEKKPAYGNEAVMFHLVTVPGDKAVEGFRNAIRNVNSRYQCSMRIFIDGRKVTIKGGDKEHLAIAVDFLEVQVASKKPLIAKAVIKQILGAPQKRTKASQPASQLSL